MARSEGEADTPTVIDVNGVKVAHLSYTYEFNGGDPPADEPYLANLIDEGSILSEAALAKEGGAEFVVVSLHWGTEYAPTPDASQVDLGPRLLGSDAIDLVIGTGSHVIQPVAAIGSEYLAYGLGNFLSNQSPESCTGCPPGTQDGVIIQLNVTETDTGGFTVTALAQTPTWVDRTTYEVVPVLHDADQRDQTVLSASADRTAAALGAMGLTVPVS
jgi:poly-gamma-glutamate synthesis protein (capsule biosynthesis protein)